MVKLDSIGQNTGLRIHLLSSPTTGIWFGGDSISRSSSSKGEVRNYAKGVRRSITWGATDETVEVNLVINTVSDLETLKSWVDSSILVRSIRGEVLAGLLTSVNINAGVDHPVATAVGSISVQLTTADGVV